MYTKEWLEIHGNEMGSIQGGVPLYRWLSEVTIQMTMEHVWEMCTGSLELVTMLEIEKIQRHVKLCAAYAEYAKKLVPRMTGMSTDIFDKIAKVGSGELELEYLTTKVVRTATANQWRLRYEKTIDGSGHQRQATGRTMSCSVERICYLDWYNAISIILQVSENRYVDDALLSDIIRKHITNPWKEEKNAA